MGSENYMSVFFANNIFIDLKVDLSIQLGAFMKLNKYQSSRLFFVLGHRSFRFQN